MEDLLILDPGERLKQIRKTLGIKQEELAGDKFSKNYISMFENNRRKISAINATYLVEKINKISEEKGKSINITSAYFMKNESDIAYDKCVEWLAEVETNLNLSRVSINTYLYKVIKLSSEYNHIEFVGRALYLKGLVSLRNRLYNCALTQLIESIVYYSKINDRKTIGEIYKNIGICLYEQNHFREALTLLTLSESTLINSKSYTGAISDEIKFMKARCYLVLGNHEDARNVIQQMGLKTDLIIELENRIKNVFTK